MNNHRIGVKETLKGQWQRSSKSAQIREYIGGELVNSSLEWADLEFLVNLDSTGRANVSIQRLTFTRAAYNKVKSAH